MYDEEIQPELVRKQNPKRKCTKKKKMPYDCVTNHPSWYEQDGAPLIGANFAKLQQVEVDPETGLRLESAIFHDCALTLPMDNDNSFFTQCANFYEEIRERNSGAANYSVYTVMAYVHNYRIAAALFAHLDKSLAAIRASMKSAVHSANILANACRLLTYSNEIATLANTTNTAAMVGKRLSDLPMVPMTILDLDRFRFGTMFLDSASAKPAIMSFIPDGSFYVTDYEGKTGGAAGVTGLDTTLIGFNPDTATLITAINTVLDNIFSDEQFDILRGDIRNAYGSLSQRDYVLHPLQVSVNDAEVMSQLENLSFGGVSSGMSVSDYYCAMAHDGTVSITTPLSGILNDPLKSRLEDTKFLINWHKNQAPTAGELMAITRLMPAAQKVNGTTTSKWAYKCCDGTIVTDTYVLDSTGYNTANVWRFSDFVTDLQSSSIQSTMKAAFQRVGFLASNFDHFPLVYTDTSITTGYEYIWDVDNYAVIDLDMLHTLTTRVVRSLFAAHLPRGEHGRRETLA